MTGTECDAEIDPNGPQPTVGDVNVTPKVEAIIESLEQFRESGTYKQTADCPDSVNLKKGKKHGGLNLKLYKPVAAGGDDDDDDDDSGNIDDVDDGNGGPQ